MAPMVRRIAAHEALQLREIRLTALADAPFAFARTHTEEAAHPYSFWADRVLSNASGARAATFVAETQGMWVGMVAGYRESTDVPCIELVSMWVAPAGRGLGTGRALVAAVVSWAAEICVPEVALWVTEGNDPAIALYQTSGFMADDIYQPLPSEPCRNELRMRLVLDPPRP